MIKFAFMINRLPALTLEDFIDYHRSKHAPLFMSIPESTKYVRRYSVSHPINSRNYPHPKFDALTEIWFESWEDHDAFFSSENFKLKVEPDHRNFFDETNMTVMVTHETVIA